MIDFYVGPEEQFFAIDGTALAKVPHLVDPFSPSGGRTYLADIEPPVFHHLILYLSSSASSPKLPENPSARPREGKSHIAQSSCNYIDSPCSTTWKI